MNMRLFAVRAALACAAMLGAANSSAAVVTIEPDMYPVDTNISRVGPGALLITVRKDPTRPAGMTAPVFTKPFSWTAVGSAPTGSLLFGHQPPGPPDHWTGLVHAQSCLELVSCHVNFYVFYAYFVHGTNFVQVQTAMMPWSLDGAELWAFDSSGKRIAECYVSGVTDRVSRTGIMDNPTYGTRLRPRPAPLVECGKVLERKNCEVGGRPGDCQFNVRMQIKRPNRDIAYVMFGGVYADDSTAPVDELKYDF